MSHSSDFVIETHEVRDGEKEGERGSIYEERYKRRVIIELDTFLAAVIHQRTPFWVQLKCKLIASLSPKSFPATKRI